MIYEDAARNIDSEEFEINKQVITKFIIDKFIPWTDSPYPPYPLDELMLMTATVCRFKPQLILEWGTNVGNSALIFYEIIKAFNIKTEIHSIDLPDDAVHLEHDPRYVGVAVKHISEINLHKGDGITVSLEIIKNNPVAGNILFFVDGDHQYETVKNELKNIVDNVPNAVILLHDTLYQSMDSGYNVGPFKAIRDVLQNTEYKWLAMNMGGPGMSLIYKSNNLQVKI